MACFPKRASGLIMATKEIASWAAKLSPSSLPASVGGAAQRSLYNYIGCAIGGSNHPTTTKAFRACEPFFARPTSSLYGQSRAVDAQHAALINGIASHVHDYDDTHLATIIHPTGPVASAILAFVQHLAVTRGVKVSGQDLICALVAGIETSCKLGLAVWPSHYDIGWHITSSTGSIGAAVAVGKLLQLDEAAMAHAIGIASVQVTGLREMFGSDTKSFHPGRAAQNGILAAILAEQEYTSSERALEAKRGWANVVVGGGIPQLDSMDFGKTWEIERNAFKPYPCGIVCHPAIDGAIQLRSRIIVEGRNVEDISSVMLGVHPLVIELTSKRSPRDGLEGKFSVFHGTAVGLLFGKAGPAQYDDKVVTDPEVVSLRDRIDAQIDETLAADAAVVKATFKDGTVVKQQVLHAVGSLEVEMTDAQLKAKFIDQCSLVIGERSKTASEDAWSLPFTEDVAQVVGRL